MHCINKKISIFLIVCSVLLCSFFYKIEKIQSVVMNSASGGGGCSTGCWTGNCYSLGVVGVRIALIDPYGQKVAGTRVVDLYYFKANAYPDAYLNGASIITYKNRNLKQDVNKMKTNSEFEKELITYTGFSSESLITEISDLENGINDKTKLVSIELVLPGILTSMPIIMDHGYDGRYIGSTDDTLSYCNYKSFCNSRVANSTNSIITKIFENAKKGDKSYIEEILKLVQSPYAIDNMPQGYYLQFEGLSQFQNGYNCIYNFVGTSSEFTKLISVAKNNEIYLTYSKDKKGKIVPACKVGTDIFDSGIVGYYYSLETIGVYAPNANKIPNKIFSAATYNNSYAEMRDHPNTAYGVGFIALDDVLKTKPPCDDEAKTLYDDYYKKGKKADYDTKINNLSGCKGGKCEYIKSKYVDMFNLSKNDIVCGPPSCEKMANYIYDACYGKTNCKADFKYAGKNTYSSAIDKLKDNYPFSGYGDISYADDKYLNVFNYLGKPKNFCKKTSCEQLLAGHTSNDDYMDKLYEIYPDFKLLSSAFRNALGGASPSCDKVTLPDCPAKSSGNCSSGHLEFDDGDNVECIRDWHIAYNDPNNIANIQQADNGVVMDVAGNKKIYCSEKVIFNLPSSPEAKAGRLLAWGTGLDNEHSTFFNDDDAKTFGKMKIHQHCYTDDSNNKISTGTTIKWNNNVNTKINISYVSPNHSKDGYLISDSIKGELDPNSIQFFAGYEGGAITIDGTVTSPISDYIVEATYIFEYGNKFSWFSNKGTSDKYISYNDYNNLSDKNTYNFIGYGLPTSLSTPDVNYTSDSDYVVAYIKDIGTNSRWNMYVEKVLKQNSGYKYSCDFKIHNELFGYECYDKNGKFLYEANPNEAPEYCKNNRSPEGIDVVFRTVELVNSSAVDKQQELERAFPGRAGSGRIDKIGRNWSNIVEDVNQNTDEILKILSSDVYDQDYPQYYITLDTSTISYIREKNKNMESPYTNMSDEYYVCSKQTATEYGYCASEFLTYLIQGGNLSGTCSNPPSTDARASKGPCGQEWWNN